MGISCNCTARRQPATPDSSRQRHKDGTTFNRPTYQLTNCDHSVLLFPARDRTPGLVISPDKRICHANKRISRRFPLLYFEKCVKRRPIAYQNPKGPGRGVEVGNSSLHSQFYSIRGWVINARPRPLYPWKTEPVPIVQRAVWTSGSVWTGTENLSSTEVRTP